MRYHNVNISCSIKFGIKLDTIILKIKCYEKRSRSYHERAKIFFLPDLLKCDPKQVKALLNSQRYPRNYILDRGSQKTVD